MGSAWLCASDTPLGSVLHLLGGLTRSALIPPKEVGRIGDPILYMQKPRPRISTAALTVLLCRFGDSANGKGLGGPCDGVDVGLISPLLCAHPSVGSRGDLAPCIHPGHKQLCQCHLGCLRVTDVPDTATVVLGHVCSCTAAMVPRPHVSLTEQPWTPSYAPASSNLAQSTPHCPSPVAHCLQERPCHRGWPPKPGSSLHPCTSGPTHSTVLPPLPCSLLTAPRGLGLQR